MQRVKAMQVMEKVNSDGKRQAFSIVSVTANREAWREYKRGLRDDSEIGGNVIIHPLCVINQQRGMHSKKDKTAKRAPNHFRNKTRNIVLMPADQIISIHYRLVMHINNTEIAY